MGRAVAVGGVLPQRPRRPGLGHGRRGGRRPGGEPQIELRAPGRAAERVAPVAQAGVDEVLAFDGECRPHQGQKLARLCRRDGVHHFPLLQVKGQPQFVAVALDDTPEGGELFGYRPVGTEVVVPAEGDARGRERRRKLVGLLVRSAAGVGGVGRPQHHPVHAGRLQSGRVDLPLPLGDVEQLDRRGRWRRGRRRRFGFGFRLDGWLLDSDGRQPKPLEPQVVRGDAPVAAQMDGQFQLAAGVVEGRLDGVVASGRQRRPAAHGAAVDLDHRLRVVRLDLLIHLAPAPVVGVGEYPAG